METDAARGSKTRAVSTSNMEAAMADDDKTQSTNDDQASKLIAALAPKIAEAILPQITESVETQMKGLKDKNDELLDKLAKQKASDDQLESVKTLVAALEGKQQQERVDAATGHIKFPSEGQNIRISKVDARDPSKYREAKKLAADRGVDLEIDRGAA
jgi:hypothetical protein